VYNRALTGGFETATNRLWAISKNEPRGVFGNTINAKDNPEFYRAISPLFNIPKAAERKLPPQLVTVGTKDRLIESVPVYVKALQAAGQPVEYWEHEGRPHGYLDRGENKNAGTSFVKDGAPAVDKIIEFLNRTIGRKK